MMKAQIFDKIVAWQKKGSVTIRGTVTATTPHQFQVQTDDGKKTWCKYREWEIVYSYDGCGYF